MVSRRRSHSSPAGQRAYTKIFQFDLNPSLSIVFFVCRQKHSEDNEKKMRIVNLHIFDMDDGSKTVDRLIIKVSLDQDKQPHTFFTRPDQS